jgi:hypothetical protein
MTRCHVVTVSTRKTICFLLFTSICIFLVSLGSAFQSTTTATSPVPLLRQQQQQQQQQMASLLWGQQNEGEEDFWKQQRELMNEMTDRTERSLRKEQLDTFGKVQGKLIEETAFVTVLIFSSLWLACDNPFVPFSYAFGAVFGLAYAYGLGKYVETLGGTVDDASTVQGAGVGQARFAFLILLFIFVGKLRVYGLIEIPAISGFFTYQIASLFQGLREETT